MILVGGYSLFSSMVGTVLIVFQAQEAMLSPLQLVLIGTALEATVFICEVPTGVVADVYSRRLSVLLGLAILGCGFMLSGAFARFDTLLLGSIVWGVGDTFISGAQQAWLADEIGVQRANRVYLRGTQVELLLRIVAVPIAVAIGSYDLNLPILIGGAMLVVLGAGLAVIMPENGFKRGLDRSKPTMQSLTGTLRSGGRLVRHSPLLLTLFAIAAFYGMSSEGFDRLWEAHFLRDLGFPTFIDVQPIVWFGAIRIGSAIISLPIAELAHRYLDTDNLTVLSRSLFLINVFQILGVAVLAVAGGFWVGVAAFWSTVTLSRVFDPLYLAWINHNVDSSVRATVFSMSSQSDAFGQIAGGPVIGAVGSLASIRAALSLTSVVLFPALLLYVRAIRLDGGWTPAGTVEKAEHS